MIRYRLEDLGEQRGRTYLHHILRPDEDPEFHDHPWGFDVYLLINGYEEERVIFWEDGPNTVNATHRHEGAHYHIYAHCFHRIASLPKGPVRSVIRTGPKEKSWSFLNHLTDVRTPWREFVAAKEGLAVLP
jgi:hypothetical protein